VVFCEKEKEREELRKSRESESAGEEERSECGRGAMRQGGDVLMRMCPVKTSVVVVIGVLFTLLISVVSLESFVIDVAEDVKVEFESTTDELSRVVGDRYTEDEDDGDIYIDYEQQLKKDLLHLHLDGNINDVKNKRNIERAPDDFKDKVNQLLRWREDHRKHSPPPGSFLDKKDQPPFDPNSDDETDPASVFYVPDYARALLRDLRSDADEGATSSLMRRRRSSSETPDATIALVNCTQGNNSVFLLLFSFFFSPHLPSLYSCLLSYHRDSNNNNTTRSKYHQHYRECVDQYHLLQLFIWSNLQLQLD